MDESDSSQNYDEPQWYARTWDSIYDICGQKYKIGIFEEKYQTALKTTFGSK